MLGIMAAILAGASLQTSNERFEFTQVHMGVATRLVVVAPTRAEAEMAGTAAFARIEELEALFSDYRPTSEISRLSAKAGTGEWMPVSTETVLLLMKAERVREQSLGLFDITAGPVVALWRASRDGGQLPSHEEVRKAKQLVDGRQVRIRPFTEPYSGPPRYEVRLAKQGMKIDFGGIAKGYACDEAMRVLEEQGIEHALIEMGGDLAVKGRSPGTDGWSVYIPSLRQELNLTNCAVSTSGDTEQFIEIGGRRYGHIVDLRTGLGTVQRVQATVISPRGLDTDPWATALCAGGPMLVARARRFLPPSSRVEIRIAN
ncbi:MAG: FAD:protein FMN transferase [Fimbriimonadaceae bacterium]|nr:FAD:protein FMN transferase [Fimbriimonadaceae bacterium]